MNKAQELAVDMENHIEVLRHLGRSGFMLGWADSGLTVGFGPDGKMLTSALSVTKGTVFGTVEQAREALANYWPKNGKGDAAEVFTRGELIDVVIGVMTAALDTFRQHENA